LFLEEVGDKRIHDFEWNCLLQREFDVGVLGKRIEDNPVQRDLHTVRILSCLFWIRESFIFV